MCSSLPPVPSSSPSVHIHDHPQHPHPHPHPYPPTYTRQSPKFPFPAQPASIPPTHRLPGPPVTPPLTPLLVLTVLTDMRRIHVCTETSAFNASSTIRWGGERELMTEASTPYTTLHRQIECKQGKNQRSQANTTIHPSIHPIPTQPCLASQYKLAPRSEC